MRRSRPEVHGDRCGGFLLKTAYRPRARGAPGGADATLARSTPQCRPPNLRVVLTVGQFKAEARPCRGAARAAGVAAVDEAPTVDPPPDGAPRSSAPAAEASHEGTFALTVHKAQGSEFGRIALVTGHDSAVLTRELLFTGITRAGESAALYVEPAVPRAGIGRRLRMTGLADRLRTCETADTPNPSARPLVSL